MWVFFPCGFFSIVWNTRANALAVRARVRSDLDALRARYLPELSEIVVSKHADYPYRAFASRKAVAQAIAKMVMDIDYTNFKNAVTTEQGSNRHDLYLRVWSVMLGAEAKLKQPISQDFRDFDFSDRYDLFDVEDTDAPNDGRFDLVDVEDSGEPEDPDSRTP